MNKIRSRNEPKKLLKRATTATFRQVSEIGVKSSSSRRKDMENGTERSFLRLSSKFSQKKKDLCESVPEEIMNLME